jgi:hypothetical protein
MATIVTRAGKGSALTWTEADANITNLNTAKLENVVEDTTPQLGGDLDVNGKKITSASNGNVAIEPNGTGIVTANKNIETTADVKAKELWSTNSTGDEGGQINLAQPATNSTLAGDTVTVDIYQNRFRIFEQGGDARGVYIDLTSAATGVGTNLLSGSGATTLDGLSDVVITAAATNDVLVYNGTNWVDTAANTLTVSAASTATTATNANNINIASTDGNTADTTTYVALAPALATGNQQLHIDGGLVYNASTNVLTATGFAGALNGTVGATTPSTGAFTTLTTSGATNNAKLTLDTTAVNSTAWGVNGIGFRSQSATFTDTSSTGTVSDTAIHSILAPTIASTNTTTVTNAYTLLVNGAPTAGANTTITNGFAIWASGTVRASQFQGAIGTITPSTGAFATLSATGAVTLSPANAAVAISPTGTGTVTISPAGALTINPTTASTINNTSIGATTASTGRFTTVTSTIATGTAPFTVTSTTNVANLNASSLNGATFAAPGAIGSTTASTGAFTTLSASSTVSGTGFSTYLASPPAIGGTTAAAGRFTTLTTTNTTATIVSESNGNIAIAPNGTGQTIIKNLEYNENVFAIGTTSGTITPDVANGNVQTITLNGNLTFSAFANPVSGQSLTLIITTGGTGRTLTSTMLFSGGSKTLSTTSTVDILTVSYIGTTYYASLGKDFK